MYLCVLYVCEFQYESLHRAIRLLTDTVCVGWMDSIITRLLYVSHYAASYFITSQLLCSNLLMTFIHSKQW